MHWKKQGREGELSWRGLAVDEMDKLLTLPRTSLINLFPPAFV